MNHILLFLTLLSAASVAATLFGGLFVMARGGEIDKKFSNRLMRARIIMQGVTIALFLLTLLVAKK